MENRVLIGLGSNLGEREVLIEKALVALKAMAASNSWSVSSLYETASIGFDGPDYLNAVCCFTTDLSVDALFQGLTEIENDAGRIRSFPNAPRVLDLDLLFYGAETITRDHLIVPHPRLHERAFVLVPLCEIAPQWIHPVFNQTVDQILRGFSSEQVSGVKKYENYSKREAVSKNA